MDFLAENYFSIIAFIVLGIVLVVVVVIKNRTTPAEEVERLVADNPREVSHRFSVPASGSASRSSMRKKADKISDVYRDLFQAKGYRLDARDEDMKSEFLECKLRFVRDA